MQPMRPGPPLYSGAVTSLRPRALTTAVTAGVVMLLMLSGCSSAPPGSDPPAVSPNDEMSVIAVQAACDGDEGVTVSVDASALGAQDDVSATWCVFTDTAIPATDVLAGATVETEGTDEYGDQVVCRVNGVPAEDVALTAEDGSDYFETCASMPAAFAYWSLWVQPVGGEWAYAEEGLSTLELDPGEGLALLFTLNGEPAAPSS